MPTIVGTEGADDLTGGPEDDLVQGLGGDDNLRGGQGRDTIDGGAGTDVIFDQDAGRYLGGAGNDFISVAIGAVSGQHEIYEDGGDGDDFLSAVAGTGFQASSAVVTATLVGGAGADTITASSRAVATVDAGTGDDTVVVTGLNFLGATVTLGAGSDRLRWEVNAGSRC